MSRPRRARVVIVGGGFAGVATAYALARNGVDDVVLVEREQGFGHHASGRNAALGRQLVEDDRTTRLAIRGAAFLREPPADFADTPLWRPVGSLLLADDAQASRELAARAEAHGVAHERISMAAAAARVSHLEGAGGEGGIYVPSDGVIDVHALLMGFLRGARRGGVECHTGCEVLGIDRQRGGFRVATTRGPIEARTLAIAGGAWAARVAAMTGARDPGLVPIRRHLFVTQPLARPEPALPFVWHLGADAYYFRPEGGGLLVSACDERASTPGEVAVQAGALEHLAEKLARAVPRLASLGIARAWACQRTFAPDRRPVIGWDESAEGVFWVAGLGGHGATASAAIGAEAAEAIAG